MARTTLNIDDDVLAAARELAARSGRPLGVVVSDLARRGLTPAHMAAEGVFPVILVPTGTPAISPEMVQRALDEM